MAAIDDLIAQIDDRALRERLREEAARLTRNKRWRHSKWLAMMQRRCCSTSINSGHFRPNWPNGPV